MARQAARETGIPQAVGSASSLILSTLGLMIGMSVLFLLLRKPAAFESITGGATNVVRSLIAPVDPLARGSTATATAAGSSNVQTTEQITSAVGTAEAIAAGAKVAAAAQNINRRRVPATP